MSANLLGSAVWLLCLCTAVALPLRATRGRTDAAALSAGFASIVLVGLWLPISAAGIALSLGGVTAWQLLKPSRSTLASFWSGAAASAGAATQNDLGAPWLLALPLAFAIAFGAWWQVQRKPDFSLPTLRTQALMGLTWLGLLIAAMPGVIDGWHSAQTLTRTVEASTDQTIPPWIWPCALTALLLGFLRGVWGRR